MNQKEKIRVGQRGCEGPSQYVRILDDILGAAAEADSCANCANAKSLMTIFQVGSGLPLCHACIRLAREILLLQSSKSNGLDALN